MWCVVHDRVGHLAGKLVREIQHRQPELLINEVDVLSVMVAGLCHDLGLSHCHSHIYKGRGDILIMKYLNILV